MSDLEHPDRLPGLGPDELTEDARRLLGVTVDPVGSTVQADSVSESRAIVAACVDMNPPGV